MFTKGTKVKLSDELLNRAYPNGGGYRLRAERKRFIVVGYSRDREHTRVQTIGHTSVQSYRNEFLVKAS
jgi:hypothetical protein